MTCIQITDSNFDSEVLQSDKPVLVDFYSDTCPPCKIIAPVIDKLAAEYDGRVKVCKANVTNASNSAMKMGLMSVPTVLVFSKGEVKTKLVGAMPVARYMAALDELLG